MTDKSVSTDTHHLEKDIPVCNKTKEMDQERMIFFAHKRAFS